MKKRNVTASDWVSTKELCQSLNCSERHLFNLRAYGVFKPKLHWRVKNPRAARLTYQYHKQRCLEAVEVLEDVGDRSSSSAR